MSHSTEHHDADEQSTHMLTITINPAELCSLHGAAQRKTCRTRETMQLRDGVGKLLAQDHTVWKQSLLCPPGQAVDFAEGEFTQ